MKRKQNTITPKAVAEAASSIKKKKPKKWRITELARRYIEEFSNQTGWLSHLYAYIGAHDAAFWVFKPLLNSSIGLVVES